MSRLISVFTAILSINFMNQPTLAQDTTFSSYGLNQPTIKRTTVFIPGIMGSRLQVGDEVIWGEFPYDPELLVYRGEESIADASPLQSVLVSGWNLRDRAYGNNFKDTFLDLEAEDWFRPFAYDWRASNETSARLLNTFLCNSVDSERGPVVIVAHSMGGVVLKLWLMNHYEAGCASQGGTKVQIDTIVFVATPHYGAPDTFKTLMTGSPKLFPILEEHYLPHLGTIGLSFDSIFQLLPMQHAYTGPQLREDTLCMKDSKVPSSVERLRIFHKDARGILNPVNIYSATVWSRFGFASRLERLLGEYRIPSQSPEIYLQEKLDDARRISCQLIGFQIPQELSDKVIYLAGSLLEDSVIYTSTVDAVLVSDLKISNAKIDLQFEDGYSSEQKYLYSNFGPGDATVTEDVATLGRSPLARRENADHIGILNSFAFLDVFELAQTRAELGSGSSLGLPIDRAVARPILQISSLLQRAGAVVPSHEWLEIENRSGNSWITGINVEGLANAAKLMTEEQRNTVLASQSQSSAMLQMVFSGQIESAEEAASALLDSNGWKTGDFHFAAALAKLPEKDRASVALRAADGYFLESEPELARSMYQLAGSSASLVAESNVTYREIAARAVIGSVISSNVIEAVYNGGASPGKLAMQWTSYIDAPSSQSLVEIAAAVGTVESVTQNFSIHLNDVVIEDRLSTY